MLVVMILIGKGDNHIQANTYLKGSVSGPVIDKNLQ